MLFKKVSFQIISGQLVCTSGLSNAWNFWRFLMLIWNIHDQKSVHFTKWKTISVCLPLDLNLFLFLSKNSFSCVLVIVRIECLFFVKQLKSNSKGLPIVWYTYLNTKDFNLYPTLLLYIRSRFFERRRGIINWYIWIFLIGKIHPLFSFKPWNNQWWMLSFYLRANVH